MNHPRLIREEPPLLSTCQCKHTHNLPLELVHAIQTSTGRCRILTRALDTKAGFQRVGFTYLSPPHERRRLLPNRHHLHPITHPLQRHATVHEGWLPVPPRRNVHHCQRVALEGPHAHGAIVRRRHEAQAREERQAADRAYAHRSACMEGALAQEERRLQVISV